MDAWGKADEDRVWRAAAGPAGPALPQRPSSQEHRSPADQGTHFQGATGGQEAPGTEATPLFLQT